MDFFVLTLMQRPPAQAKAGECGFALNEESDIKVCDGVIIGVAPIVTNHNALTDGALDLFGAVVPFAYEARRHREGRRFRDGPQPGERSRGGAQVKPRTEVAQERQRLARSAHVPPRSQVKKDVVDCS